jgi:hypothetical protein
VFDGAAVGGVDGDVPVVVEGEVPAEVVDLVVVVGADRGEQGEIGVAQTAPGFGVMDVAGIERGGAAGPGAGAVHRA